LKAGLELLKPAPDDLLQKWPASRRVNNSRASDDDPTLINDNVISPAKADTEKGKRERLVRLHNQHLHVSATTMMGSAMELPSVMPRDLDTARDSIVNDKLE
jgi:hypothetical protein